MGKRRRNSPQKIPRNSRRKQEKNPSFPPKTRKIPRHSRESGNHYGRLILEFPRVFFVKNGVNAGICRQKWIPAFAGMTAGRREFSGENRTAAGGGIPQKNGGIRRKKSPAIPAENKKNPPSFPPKTRKTPRHSRESGNPLWAINFWNSRAFFS